MSRSYFIILVLVVFSFSSCSKDEVPENPTSPGLPPEATLKTGVFLDSPVEGLIYRTATLEGVTNSKGEFQYMEREKVSFFIGSIKIGEAVGKNLLSPIDIAGTPNATINTLEVKNIAAFLQTLDADKNPDNGIKISSEAIAALPQTQIDFRNHFIQKLGEIVAEINQKTLMNLQVVFPEAATSHLSRTLQLEYVISGLEAGAFFDIIERWDTRTRNVNWIHKFDSQGKIIESLAFEKFPWRPLLKYVYKNYNSNGYPQFFEGHYLNQEGSSGWFLNFYLSYGGNSQVTTYSWSPDFITDPDYYVWKILKIDEKRRVTEFSHNPEGSLFGTTVLEYDDLNNSLKNKFFEPGGSEPKSVNDFFFTDFGSLKTAKAYSGSRLTQLTNRFYREDHTLEKLEIIQYKVSGEILKTVEFKNENGGTYRVEKYSNDFLLEYYERYGDRTSKTWVYNKEDDSYYIEYRDADNRKFKTEFYDSDDNLLRTV